MIILEYFRLVVARRGRRVDMERGYQWSESLGGCLALHSGMVAQFGDNHVPHNSRQASAGHSVTMVLQEHAAQ